jgi:diacylglycerol kinase (ATP)
MRARPGQNQMRRLHRATRNSLRGFAFAYRSEAALREELLILLAALPLGLAVAPSAAWYVAMIGVLLLTLAVELLNTGIEKLADHVTPERHPAIGAVKDMASAAVSCAITLAALTWAAALGLRLGLF